MESFLKWDGFMSENSNETSEDRRPREGYLPRVVENALSEDEIDEARKRINKLLKNDETETFRFENLL